MRSTPLLHLKQGQERATIADGVARTRHGPQVQIGMQQRVLPTLEIMQQKREGAENGMWRKNTAGD
jgi:hypothetical protein